MTADVPADVVEPVGGRRRWRRTAIVSAILLLLFGVPWWTLVAGAAWPTPVVVAGTVLFAVAFVSLPAMLFSGHFPGRGRERPDWVAATADTPSAPPIAAPSVPSARGT